MQPDLSVVRFLSLPGAFTLMGCAMASLPPTMAVAGPPLRKASHPGDRGTGSQLRGRPGSSSCARAARRPPGLHVLLRLFPGPGRAAARPLPESPASCASQAAAQNPAATGQAPRRDTCAALLPCTLGLWGALGVERTVRAFPVFGRFPVPSESCSLSFKSFPSKSEKAGYGTLRIIKYAV